MDSNIKTESAEKSVAAFETAVIKKFCPQCGKAITDGTKRKKFCSDTCRWNWWNRHPKPENWNTTEKKICPVCGEEFLARIQKGRARQYCSRACSNRARGGKAGGDCG